jgi:hypothetical protein
MANQYSGMNNSWASGSTDWNSARGNGTARPPEGGVYLDEREEERLLDDDYVEEQDDDEEDYYSTLNVSPTVSNSGIGGAWGQRTDMIYTGYIRSDQSCVSRAFETIPPGQTDA